MNAASQRHELLAALEAFDRAFIEGRADELGALFDDDAQLLLHHQPPIVGRQSITEAFRETFAAFDTSAYEPTYETVEVHTDNAYVLASFTEVLRPREGGPGLAVIGRVVLFWRRGPLCQSLESPRRASSLCDLLRILMRWTGSAGAPGEEN